jgi:glycine amidinotransferase
MSKAIVSSFNEWDPLEEVIIGTLDKVTVPFLSHEMKVFIRKEYWDFYKKYGGQPYPKEFVEKGVKALNNLEKVLEAEGVKVRRPEPVRFDPDKRVTTPHYESTGFFNADVRDILLIVGDTIIEAPMAQRCRAFEYLGYQDLILEYFKSGAKWLCAPKGSKSSELYDYEYPEEDMALFRGEPISDTNVSVFNGRFITTEHEICFDAADFVRCGRDIFAQRSHVTNQLGIDWVRSILEPTYKVHNIKFRDPSPVHIDATWLPIGEGKVLSCPDRVCISEDMLALFKNSGWEIFYPPPGEAKAEFHMSSRWLSMNILMLDPERVVVEKDELATIKFFKKIGIKPILVDFKDHYMFGGGIHCATADVRRRGELKSYFNN